MKVVALQPQTLNNSLAWLQCDSVSLTMSSDLISARETETKQEEKITLERRLQLVAIVHSLHATNH